MTYLNPQRRVLVVGGGYAGVLAANRLAGRLDDQSEVVLVTPGHTLTDRIRLHELAARGRGVQHALDKLLHARVRRLDARLVSIDSDANTVTIECSGAHESLAYDALLLALGSRLASRLPAHSEHAFALRDVRSAEALRRTLLQLPRAARVGVVGGGLTAIELAAEIAEAHPSLRVALVAGQLAPQLAGPAQDALRAALGALHVEVLEGRAVAELEPDALRFTDESRLPCAVSVLAAGFVPSCPAAGLGLPAAPDGRVSVDEQLRVCGLSNVFAVGDMAAPPESSVGSGLATTRMGCVSAMPMGAHAADQVTRLFRRQALLPYRFHYFVQCISVGRRQGLLLFVDADDKPTGRVLRGRRGALMKELICRFVIGAIRLERSFAGLYAWPGRPSPLRLPGFAPNQLPG
jgi:NADH dehydrogenase